MKKLGLMAVVLTLGACGFQPAPNCRGGKCDPYPQQQAPCAQAQTPCAAQQLPCGGYVPAPAPMPVAYDPYYQQPQQVEYVDPYYQQAPEPYYQPMTNEKPMNRRNIVIKDKTPYSVTYEFYQVRLDELAKYADEYCGYMNLKSILRESLTARNNSRIATFDCVNPKDLK